MPRRPLSLRTRISIDVAMVLLAIASVGLVVYEVVALQSEPSLLLDMVDLALVLIFAAEFVWSARASGDWRRYTKENWYDLPGLIWVPGTFLEGLRGLRLLRVIRLLRLLRIVRAAARLRRLTRLMGNFAGRARIAYIAFVGFSTIVLGGIGAFLAEQGVPDSKFTSVEDGIWWAVVTTATVGYGDIYPVTMAGRAVGIVLMVVGVGVIGTLAASLGAALTAPAEVDSPTGHKRVLSKWHR